MLWAVEEKAKPGGRLTARQRARNHRFGKARKSSMCFVSLSASSAIARCVIAASPMGPRYSRCWRSQTCISPARHLRPPDDTRPSAPDCRYELAALTRKTFA